MGIQDVDFELVYEPGKADPRTSYKTLITKEKQWCVEKVIKYVVKANHALVVNHIKEEIHKYLKDFRNCPSKFDLEW